MTNSEYLDFLKQKKHMFLDEVTKIENLITEVNYRSMFDDASKKLHKTYRMISKGVIFYVRPEEIEFVDNEFVLYGTRIILFEEMGYNCTKSGNIEINAYIYENFEDYEEIERNQFSEVMQTLKKYMY
jgi:hypothetical protein